MPADSGESVIQRLYDEVLVGGDVSAIDELFHPDCISYTPSCPEGLPGRDYYRDLLLDLRRACPEVSLLMECLETIVLGLIVVTWKLTGGCADARGQRITGTTVFRVENGTVRESWCEHDQMGTLWTALVPGDGAATTPEPQPLTA
ncbi:MAG: ester cyclase [Chloroflexota bacterium]|nr:ester cyclase [Chloroflexota bacterium]